MDSEEELESKSRFVDAEGGDSEEETEEEGPPIEIEQALQKLESVDPEEDLVSILQAKTKIKKKISVDDAVAWVESQLHDVRLMEEEEIITSEYENLKRQMERLEEEHMKALAEAENDPDQEERQVTDMMSDAQRTRDTIMKQHFKGTNKIEKLRQDRH